MHQILLSCQGIARLSGPKRALAASSTVSSLGLVSAFGMFTVHVHTSAGRVVLYKHALDLVEISGGSKPWNAAKCSLIAGRAWPTSAASSEFAMSRHCRRSMLITGALRCVWATPRNSTHAASSARMVLPAALPLL